MKVSHRAGPEPSGGMGGLTNAIAGIGSLIPRKGFGNVAGGALQGAGTGAAIGSAILPGPGTVIGGIIGGVGGALKGGGDWRAEQHQRQIEALKAMGARFIA